METVSRSHGVSRILTPSIRNATVKAPIDSWCVFNIKALHAEQQIEWGMDNISGENLPQRGNSHFLEEIPVGDDFELLQNEVDATFDEESLISLHGFIQKQKIPRTETRSKILCKTSENRVWTTKGIVIRPQWRPD